MCVLGRGDWGGAGNDDVCSSSSTVLLVDVVVVEVVAVVVRVIFSPLTISAPSPLSASRVTYLSCAGDRKGTGANPVSPLG